MIRRPANILLLAERTLGEEVRSLRWPGQVVHRDEPYAALEELARRRYQAVILTHPQADFEGLVRAVRRLQNDAGIYALCSPAGEARLRTSRPEGLTDYLVYPPTEQELARIARPAPAEKEAETAANLTPQEVGELVEACSSAESLAERVATMVEEWSSVKVRWSEATAAADDECVLLLLDADPPRALVCPQEQAPSPARRAKLESLQVLLGPLAGQARRTEALHRLAITDELTGAHNRRYFYHFTDQLLRRAKGERFRVTLLLYDIDNFKRYNDTYGHAAGDEVLREMARLMKQVTRAHDVVARIGGDEFTVLFWDAEPPRRPDSQHPSDAFAVAERFLAAVAGHEFPSLGPEANGVLTISGGLATFPWDGGSCRELLRHADLALRQAKASGKNAIHIIGPGGTSAPAGQ